MSIEYVWFENLDREITVGVGNQFETAQLFNKIISSMEFEKWKKRKDPVDYNKWVGLVQKPGRRASWNVTVKKIIRQFFSHFEEKIL